MNEKKYFTYFNKDEAKEYIGKRCRFSDSAKALDTGAGFIERLFDVVDGAYPFITNSSMYEYCTPVEAKLRPYESFEEVTKDAVKHGTDRYGSFYIRKIDSVKIYLVSLLNYYVVKLDTLNNSFEMLKLEELSKYYTWLDGAPCGVEEEV